jgi:hypothetical protein
MSINISLKAWDLKLSANEKLVFLAIADYSNQYGKSWPAISTIGKKCGLSPRTIHSHLSNLQKKGFISKTQRRGRSSIYWVVLDNLGMTEEKRPPQDPPETPADNADASARCAGHLSNHRTQNPPASCQFSANKKQTSDVIKLVALGIEQQVAKDWITTRKTKGAKALTQTFLNGLVREANIAGISVCVAARIAVERQWNSFNAAWITPPTTQKLSTYPKLTGYQGVFDANQ